MIDNAKNAPLKLEPGRCRTTKIDDGYLHEWIDADGEAHAFEHHSSLHSPAPECGRLPTQQEAAQAAALLLRCNGHDLDTWGAEDLLDEFPQDALKALASMADAREQDQ